MPRTRQWVRPVVGAAALALTASLGLTACSSGEAEGPVTVTWFINPDGGGSDPSKDGQAGLARICTERANGRYEIEFELLPNSASDQRQQLLRRLAAFDENVDIMSLDPVFVAEFANAGFLKQVPEDYVDDYTTDMVQPIIDSATWQDKLTGAPMWANTQLLWYRKSIAEKAGLDMTKPVTWEQLIDAAKQTEKTIGVQAKRYEGYMVWINALIMGAGGNILLNPGASAQDLQFGLETEAGKAGAEVIADVAKAGVAGPAMSSTDETAALDLFANDTTSGFLVNWPYVWAALPERGIDWVDDIGYTRYPQTIAGEESRPPIGGIVLGVSAATQHESEAWDAIKCIRDEENQKRYMLGTGNPAANKNVYNDPEVKEVFPMAALIRSSLDTGGVRPLTQYYGDVSGVMQRVYSPPNAVNPDTTPVAATELLSDVLNGRALL